MLMQTDAYARIDMVYWPGEKVTYKGWCCRQLDAASVNTLRQTGGVEAIYLPSDAEQMTSAEAQAVLSSIDPAVTKLDEGATQAAWRHILWQRSQPRQEEAKKEKTSPLKALRNLGTQALRAILL
jgi:hypothetical protein